MNEKNERRVLDLLDALVARDYDAAVGYFSPDASYHVSAWHEPVTGHEAIRAELARQAGLYTAFRYEITRIASTASTVFTERRDVITMAGRTITLHWVGVFDLDADGRIGSARDYYDLKELEAQFAPPAS